MQRTIVLIRHAKSSWADPLQKDFDRPLNDRGEHDAPLMGQRLKKHGLKPDLIISSNAKRARQTAKRIAAETGFDKHDIELEARLYLSSPEVFWDVVSGIDDEVKTAYIIAHNPGITEFVNSVAPAFKTDNMPTCGVAAFRAAASSWVDFRAADKKLILFEYPKKFYEGK